MEEKLTKDTLEEIVKSYPIQRTGIGQDSHRFLPVDSSKPCIIGGVIFDDVPGLSADSDGDVIFHAICNAITSLTSVPILGGIAQDLCHKNGITNSQVYLEKALGTLGDQKIVHLAVSIEAKRPRMQDKIDEIRRNISEILKVGINQVGITVTSGEGLTDFGRGEGLQCLCILSTIKIP